MKTHNYGRVLVAILLLSCDALFPPVPNVMDCTTEAGLNQCLKMGLVCDRFSGLCAANGGCVTATMCSMPNAAVCTSGACVPCSRDSDCTSWTSSRSETPQREFCENLNQQNTCVECRKSNDATDCPDLSKPTCDATTGLCRGCSADSECGTGICLKSGDYPTISPIAGLLPGQCVPVGQITYVNNDTLVCSDTLPTAGSMAKPFCSLGKAIMTAKPYIRVSSSTTIYSALTISSGNFVIVGPGRDVTPTAKIALLTANGGSIALSELQINAVDVNPAVSCRGNASVYLSNSVISNLNGRAIDADQDCANIVIERSRVTALKYGIVIGRTGATTINSRIVNTAVVNSGSSASGEAHGIYLGLKATGYIAFNTLTNNVRGIKCDTTLTLTDSIVAGNMQADVDGCSTTNNRVIIGTGTVDLASGMEPTLLDTTKNAGCCIDQGQMPTGTQSVLTDYYRTIRPRGKGYDVGFHELK